MNPVNLLVIRHEHCTNLGLLKPALARMNGSVRYLETAQGEELINPLTDYSHIVVLGGGMSAYEEAQYPFLRYEFDLLERAIAQRIPILGICLGSQILAKVLGASVYRGAFGREAGWCEVQLTIAATHDPLFQDLPPQFRVFQSHQDTFDLPAGSVHLAQSSLYANQAFCYQNQVWAIQFHLEIDEHVLSSCSDLITEELETSQIQDTTVQQLIDEAKRHSPAVAPLADRLMQQFLQVRSTVTSAV